MELVDIILIIVVICLFLNIIYANSSVNASVNTESDDTFINLDDIVVDDDIVAIQGKDDITVDNLIVGDTLTASNANVKSAIIDSADIEDGNYQKATIDDLNIGSSFKIQFPIVGTPIAQGQSIQASEPKQDLRTLNLESDTNTSLGDFTYAFSTGQDRAWKQPWTATKTAKMMCPAGEYMTGIYINKKSNQFQKDTKRMVIYIPAFRNTVNTQIRCRPLLVNV
jgi:hypothetical protein